MEKGENLSRIVIIKMMIIVVFEMFSFWFVIWNACVCDYLTFILSIIIPLIDNYNDDKDDNTSDITFDIYFKKYNVLSHKISFLKIAAFLS